MSIGMYVAHTYGLTDTQTNTPCVAIISPVSVQRYMRNRGPSKDGYAYTGVIIKSLASWLDYVDFSVCFLCDNPWNFSRLWNCSRENSNWNDGLGWFILLNIVPGSTMLISYYECNCAAYQLGNTSSRTITEVKLCWAWLVLGWATAQVLPECCC